jgi:hypothetical protein
VHLDHVIDCWASALARPQARSSVRRRAPARRHRPRLGRASPRLLLMDEPLAALDLKRKQEILPYLERLRDELDIPVLYVSHAPDEVARLADHLVVLDAGPRAVATARSPKPWPGWTCPFAWAKTWAWCWPPWSASGIPPGTWPAWNSPAAAVGPRDGGLRWVTRCACASWRAMSASPCNPAGHQHPEQPARYRGANGGRPPPCSVVVAAANGAHRLSWRG